MMNKMVLIAALTGLSTAAWCDWAVRGEGNFSCPEYVSAKRSNTAKLYSSISWVQGFITGVNYQRAEAGSPDSFVARDLPAASVARWLENHCEENVADDLADAAKALVEKMGS